MMSSIVRRISIIIILVVVMVLTLTAHCDEKPKKSENINNSEKSTIQMENGQFLDSKAPVLNGIILSAMQSYFQSFGLGFLIDPVLIGILKLLDRIRNTFQSILI